MSAGALSIALGIGTVAFIAAVSFFGLWVYSHLERTAPPPVPRTNLTRKRRSKR